MRKFAILGWLLLPIVAMAFHYGPGQEQWKMDDAAQSLAAAKKAVNSKDWAAAVRSYEAALEWIPAEQHIDAQRVRLELAKARMENHELPTAHGELQVLVEELSDQENGTPSSLMNETRSSLANSQFYLTWLMRLEGAPQSEWEQHIDASRQHYKLLVEESTAAGNETLLASAQHDMESAIRLARMDLGELQGLPIPSQ